MHKRVQKIRSFRRLRRVGLLKRLLCSERGTQLAELAIVMPIFLILFAATAEFGRYFYEYSTLAKATRSGARYLITSPDDGSDDTNAKNLVIYGNKNGSGSPIISGITTGNVTITRTSLGGGDKSVTVRIAGYRYRPIFDLGAMIKQPTVSLNVDVEPSVTMRHLPSI